ncbi:MAG: hypothetical protein H6732_02420 [Alphaproteobacteria bacterium]|nr:hypothetical protein [Alphaproteobacteria bacterium]
MVKRILLGLVGLVLVAVLGVGIFVFAQVRAYEASVAEVWDIPLPDFEAPDLSAVAGEELPASLRPPEPTEGEEGAEPEVADDEVPAADDGALAELRRLRATWERGRHLSMSIGACQGCHGPDLATPEEALRDMGPIGKLPPPNISIGGLLAAYSDAELHRMLVHGVKRDGTTLRFMAAQDFAWWPDEDLAALVGYLRTLPAVDRPSDPIEVGLLAKILDRMDMMPITIARRMDHETRDIAPEPAPTAAYGAYLARLCQGCHGEHLSGGPIPGAPPDLPVPLNITMHETGIAHYDFAAFETLMRTGKKPDGSDLDPFMPIKDLRNMDDVEMAALWAALQAAPKVAFGGR